MRYSLRALAVTVGLGAALLGAPAWAQPSIIITGAATSLQNTCTSSGADVEVDVIANEPAGYSDNFTITAPGFAGFTWTGENGPFSGSSPYGFETPSVWGIDVAADTLVAGSIIVYDKPDLGGTAVFKSVITWNCTTGAVVSIVNTDLTGSAVSVPALRPWVLALLACLLLGAGMVVVSRRLR